MRTLVIGDCHGGYKALKQCLERSKFDYKKDNLICLGDVCDGWPETDKCFDELLKIKNLVLLLGNHDSWLLDFIHNRRTPEIWLSQGGKATLASYGYKWQYIDHHEYIPIQHITLLENAEYYYIDKNRLFVHGGIDTYKSVEDVPNIETLLWDRNTFYSALSPAHKLDTIYDEIYIGHTTTSQFSDIPIQKKNVWLMDQGGGFEGKLSILDIDTKEFWQSDVVSSLYKSHNGRKI